MIPICYIMLTCIQIKGNERACDSVSIHLLAVNVNVPAAVLCNRGHYRAVCFHVDLSVYLGVIKRCNVKTAAAEVVVNALPLFHIKAVNIKTKAAYFNACDIESKVNFRACGEWTNVLEEFWADIDLCINAVHRHCEVSCAEIVLKVEWLIVRTHIGVIECDRHWRIGAVEIILVPVLIFIELTITVGERWRSLLFKSVYLSATHQIHKAVLSTERSDLIIDLEVGHSRVYCISYRQSRLVLPNIAIITGLDKIHSGHLWVEVLSSVDYVADSENSVLNRWSVVVYRTYIECVYPVSEIS